MAGDCSEDGNDPRPPPSSASPHKFPHRGEGPEDRRLT